LALAAAASAHADNYPSKTIRLIVPFPPGGTTDIVARIVADKLTKELGQPVIVDNRAGAGGSIGTSMVAKADPDGYTLGIATVSTHAVNPACNPKLDYDPLHDFAPISNLARTPNVLTVNPNKSTAKDFKQLLAQIKANPDKMTFATSGQCSILHMMGEEFKIATGTRITHVPYRGSGPAINDLLGGQVDMMFDNLPSSLPHIKAGKMRAMAVSWPKRLEALPDVPTFGELGLKQVNDPAWYGLVAPPKTPAAIISKLNGAVAKVLSQPDVKQKFALNASEPAANSPDAYAAEIKKELEKMKAIAKQQNIKFEGS
jgi:tripartite-type tricarboxylate transporter receptor subunit TctC